MPSTSIAFLGLGTMGGGMAARLAGAGFRVTVWNRNPQVASRFKRVLNTLGLPGFSSAVAHENAEQRALAEFAKAKAAAGGA